MAIVEVAEGVAKMASPRRPTRVLRLASAMVPDRHAGDGYAKQTRHASSCGPNAHIATYVRQRTDRGARRTRVA
jgi:hypothetical protein